MARVSMVTRTVKATKCKVLLYDKENRQTVEKEMTVSRTYKDEKALEKKLNSVLESTPNFKLVTVIDTIVIHELRGMTEDKFIAESEPIVKGDSEAVEE